MSINLGTASTYAVLAGSTVTNTGSSVLIGNIGLYSGTSVTGFPPGTYSGSLNVNNAAAIQAKSDLTTAYNACLSASTTNTLSASNYTTTNNQILTAGVYSVGTSLQINGNLILSGTSSSVFIFKIGSTLTTASSAQVQLSGGVQSSNVFWQVGSSATLGTSSSFSGYILALTSITATTSASIQGSLLARNGAVTLDTNFINNPVICYIKGTKILTKDGYKNIEDIVLGDEVSVFGNIVDKEVLDISNGELTKKVIFTGNFSRSNLNAESKPIIFKTGSLEQNIPSEDVGVSPGHGIILNNKSVLAESLVNNDTIYQSEDYETVTYYHIELENHSVINASGLLGESLLGCREKFTSV
jgi:hypothetical protein